MREIIFYITGAIILVLVVLSALLATNVINFDSKAKLSFNDPATVEQEAYKPADPVGYSVEICNDSSDSIEVNIDQALRKVGNGLEVYFTSYDKVFVTGCTMFHSLERVLPDEVAEGDYQFVNTVVYDNGDRIIRDSFFSEEFMIVR